MGGRDNKTENSSKRHMKYLPLLFIAVAVIAGTIFLIEAFAKAEQQKKYEELAGRTTDVEALPDAGADNESDKKPNQNNEHLQTNEAVETEAQELTAEEQNLMRLQEMGIPIPEKNVDFETLKEQTNADIYAWIYIPDTMIDYPILQHATDNTYYLKYNIDGSKGYPGCIYTENYNSMDFTDPVTVIYGHNMKNGSMFAGLHKFEDSEYFEEHPYVYIYTPEKLLVYEIFAAYEHSNEHLLLNYDLSSEVIFQKYLDDIMDIRTMSSNIRKDMSLSSDNHILTLSTCIADKPDNRYLVQGVLLNED